GGGGPSRVGGEEVSGDGQAVGSDDLRALRCQSLAVGEPARLGQGEYLVDQVHGRVGNGQLRAERQVVGVAGLGGLDQPPHRPEVVRVAGQVGAADQDGRVGLPAGV